MVFLKGGIATIVVNPREVSAQKRRTFAVPQVRPLLGVQRSETARTFYFNLLNTLTTFALQHT
ncbi:hypothetical protein [Cupriavidus sp. MP-37]|uniref:hypothetical protein n=1 Tax=Cupriavidus sp. MP-37 TaxID=2884455 RepID=UPI001D0A4A3A|nr:hypothetical protein [Cupriavidus sp. MP-37]UDM50921.1 hypothetical protein LIN44_03795 [Cupriavidus sp. MP-37]